MTSYNVNKYLDEASDYKIVSSDVEDSGSFDRGPFKNDDNILCKFKFRSDHPTTFCVHA